MIAVLQKSIDQIGHTLYTYAYQRGWFGDWVALIAGVVMATAFAPFHYFYAAYFAIALLFWQLRFATAKLALRRGALFGFGLFGTGVSWVYVAMQQFGHMAAPIAAFLAFCFVAVLVFFPTLCAYIYVRYFQQKNALGFACVLASLWTTAELLRTYLFGGFPWLTVGYSQVPSGLSGLLPVVGVYGVSWLVVWLAGMLAHSLAVSRWRQSQYAVLTCLVLATVITVPAFFALNQWDYWIFNELANWLQAYLAKLQPGVFFVLKILLAGIFGAVTASILWLFVYFSCFFLLSFCESLWRRQWLALWVLGSLGLSVLAGTIEWGRPAGEALTVAVLQANVPQDIKWRSGQRRKTMRLYAQMTDAHLNADIIVFPENALPAYRHTIKAYLDTLDSKAKASNTALIIGLPMLDVDTDQYYNAMLVLGEGRGEYKKHHLVPFGEFIPLKNLIGGVMRIMDMPMSDFSAGAADQPLAIVKSHPVAISICYEDAFPDEIIAHLPAAEFLVNASNNAWYGNSLAPHQHLQIAQTRAKETARYILRATTNGISAIIDHHGVIQAQSAQFQKAVVTGQVIPRTGGTPYVLLGNGLLLLLMGATFLWLKRQSLRAVFYTLRGRKKT